MPANTIELVFIIVMWLYSLLQGDPPYVVDLTLRGSKRVHTRRKGVSVQHISSTKQVARHGRRKPTGCCKLEQVATDNQTLFHGLSGRARAGKRTKQHRARA